MVHLEQPESPPRRSPLEEKLEIAKEILSKPFSRWIMLAIVFFITGMLIGWVCASDPAPIIIG